MWTHHGFSLLWGARMLWRKGARLETNQPGLESGLHHLLSKWKLGQIPHSSWASVSCSGNLWGSPLSAIFPFSANYPSHLYTCDVIRLLILCDPVPLPWPYLSWSRGMNLTPTWPIGISSPGIWNSSFKLVGLLYGGDRNSGGWLWPFSTRESWSMAGERNKALIPDYFLGPATCLTAR